MKLFYIAKYTETDAHSRDYGKQKFCRVKADGWSPRGIRLDHWFYVMARTLTEAKELVNAGKARRLS